MIHLGTQVPSFFIWRPLIKELLIKEEINYG